jgi:hypothetical protein
MELVLNNATPTSQTLTAMGSEHATKQQEHLQSTESNLRT